MEGKELDCFMINELKGRGEGGGERRWKTLKQYEKAQRLAVDDMFVVHVQL